MESWPFPQCDRQPYKSTDELFSVSLFSGSCRSTTGSLLQTLSHTTLSKVTTEASCWNECLNYPPTGSGQECVGVTFSVLSLLGGTCTAYLADILQSPSSSSLSLTLLDTTMVKECFQSKCIWCCIHDVSSVSDQHCQIMEVKWPECGRRQ